jgi:hypothetical protein
VVGGARSWARRRSPINSGSAMPISLDVFASELRFLDGESLKRSSGARCAARCHA